jgi:hypothetical protein
MLMRAVAVWSDAAVAPSSRRVVGASGAARGSYGVCSGERRLPTMGMCVCGDVLSRAIYGCT